MATKHKRRSKAKQEVHPLAFIGALAVLISLVVLGFQLAGNVSELVGIDLSGTVTANLPAPDANTDWFDNHWQYRSPVTINQNVQFIGDRGVAEVELVSENLNEDCSDVRVTTSQNEEVLSKISCSEGSATVTFEYTPGSTDFYVYYGNPSAEAPTNTLKLWRKRAQPTLRGEAPSAAAHNGLIYLVAGGKAHKTFEVYNPSTNTWEAKASLPVNVGAGSVAVTIGSLNEIRVVGGSSNIDGTWHYSIAKNEWKQGNNLILGRAYAAATNAEDNIYIFGGQGFENNQAIRTNKVEMLFRNGIWVEKTPMPTARSNLAAVRTSGDKFYVMGGMGPDNGRIKVNEVYDVATNTWSTKAPLPDPLGSRSITAVSTNGKIYVMGGTSIARTLQIYDIVSDTWSFGERLPGDKFSATSASVSGKIYVMGGLGVEATNYEYTIPNWGASALFVEEEVNENYEEDVGAQEEPETNETTEEPETNETVEEPTEEEPTIIDDVFGKNKEINCPAGQIQVGTTCVDEKGAGVCGDNVRDEGETCDGAASLACPGLCTTVCSCEYIPNNGVCEEGETGADCDDNNNLWIGLALILAVIVGVLFYFKYKGLDGFDLGSLTGKSSSDSSVKSYVASTESMGYSPSQIRGALKKKGWGSSTINKYLGKA